MNNISPIRQAASIIVVAAILAVATIVLVVPTANAQVVRIHPSCTYNPGYAHGEPQHHCPGLIRIAP